MANTKISQLPSYTGSAADLRYFVMNNSGETETFKFSGYTSPFKAGNGTNSAIDINLPSSYANGNRMLIWGNHSEASIGDNNVVLGGSNNKIIFSNNGFMLGGSNNTGNNIIGGANNTGYNIWGGNNNTFNPSGHMIGGASNNIAASNSERFTAIGSYNTTIQGNWFHYTIVAGGFNNILRNDQFGLNHRGAYIGAQNFLLQRSSVSTNGANYQLPLVLGGYENKLYNNSGNTELFLPTIIAGSGNTLTGFLQSTILNCHETEITGATRNVFIGLSGYSNSSPTPDTTYVDNIEVLNKIVLTNFASLDYADDAAADAGGIPLGGIYHTSGAVKVRIT